MRDAQKRLRARRSRVQLDQDVEAAQVHVPGHAVDADRAVDGPVARRPHVACVTDVLRIVGERLLADVEETDRDDGGILAVLLHLVAEGGVARTEGRLGAGGARQLDRCRGEERVERRQRRPCSRNDLEHGSRAVRHPAVHRVWIVHEVVVHLHHDECTAVQEHPRAGRQIVRGASGNPGSDPLRRAEPVARDVSGRRAGLREPRAAEAAPSLAPGRRVQALRFGRVRPGRLEQDHVMDELGALRLDSCRRDEHVLRELRVEHEAVVVVGGARRRARRVGARGYQRDGSSRGCRGPAHGLQGGAVPELCSASHPARDQVLLLRREDPARGAEVSGRVGAGHPRRHGAVPRPLQDERCVGGRGLR